MDDKFFRLIYWVALLNFLACIYVSVKNGNLWSAGLWIFLGILCIGIYCWNERRKKKRKVDKND